MRKWIVVVLILVATVFADIVIVVTADALAVVVVLAEIEAVIEHHAIIKS